MEEFLREHVLPNLYGAFVAIVGAVWMWFKTKKKEGIENDGGIVENAKKVLEMSEDIADRLEKQLAASDGIIESLKEKLRIAIDEGNECKKSMNKILITIILMVTVKLLVGQDKIVQGTFTHGNLTFTVSNALDNRYKIQSNKWYSFPENPTIIDGIESEIILGATKISNINKYKSYIKSLPNFTELQSNGEIIILYYNIDGKGNVLDLVIYVSKNTKLTISNIKGLYDYIKSNEKPTIKGFKHYSQYLKSIIITKTYNFAELQLIPPR